MLKYITFIILICVLSFKSYAFEPYSGISCHNSTIKGKVEFFLVVNWVNSVKIIRKTKLLKHYYINQS